MIFGARVLSVRDHLSSARPDSRAAPQLRMTGRCCQIRSVGREERA
jgi:hypothetical protein